MSPAPSLPRIRRRLADYRWRALPGRQGMARAAVALVLRDAAEAAEVLMIRRADRTDDPWSGHMGFPGGRMEPGDGTIERTAVRETCEELGVSLDASGRPLGRLSELQARSRSGWLPLSIQPFVFELTEAVALRPNEEVVEALWIPVGFFREGDNRSTLPYAARGIETLLPCYRFQDRLIWGLSLAMLDELVFQVLADGAGS